MTTKSGVQAIPVNLWCSHQSAIPYYSISDPIDSMRSIRVLKLDWQFCEGYMWCPLYRLDLDKIELVSGVYIIWYFNSNNQNRPITIYVGQGNIADRLNSHREDPDIRYLKSSGLDLCVSWCAVHERNRDGVENYLGEVLSPLVGERYPNVSPIEVNLPSCYQC